MKLAWLSHEVDQCSVSLLLLATTLGHCGLWYHDKVDQEAMVNVVGVAHGHMMCTDIHPKVKKSGRHVDDAANLRLQVSEGAEAVDEGCKLEGVGTMHVISEIEQSFNHDRVRQLRREEWKLIDKLDTRKETASLFVEVYVLATEDNGEV